MADLYITTKSGAYHRPYRTQADADAAAAADSTLTAYQGTIDVPQNAEPGVWVLSGSSLVDPESSLTLVEQLKLAARAQRDTILSYEDLLAQIGRSYPSRDRALAQDYLSWALWGGRAVFLSTTLSAQVKLGWIQSVSLGPSDLPLTTPTKFFSIVRGWTDAEVAARRPTERVVFASTAAPFTRFALRAAKSGTAALTGLAADPTTDEEIQKVGTGGWIDDIRV